MGRSCREIQDWIETQIEQPIEAWEDQQQERCENQPCNWWVLCLNKVVCWLVWVAVKIIRFVLVTVGKWVGRIVCTIVNVLLDVAAAIGGLILSIPIIGGIIRTALNWGTEIFWRIASLPEFLGSLLGLRLRKKMYFGIIIPVVGGSPIATAADMQPQVDKAIDLYDTLCNIDLRFTGFCTFRAIEPPEGAMNPVCSFTGLFADWWLPGSWYELASLGCKFESGWRRIAGYGGEIIVFVVSTVLPDGAGGSTVGCSFLATHDYVTVEADSSDDTTAHEMGHACLLGHNNSANNLMHESTSFPSPTLTNFQIATVRSSRHCIYF